MPTTVSGMKCVLWFAVAALTLVVAEGTPAHASPPQAKQPRAYGTPIQPPIVKKRAPKKTKANGVATAKSTTAKHKSNAEAARKAKADLAWRRAHPASADGPR